jgi:hypothetical protein
VVGLEPDPPWPIRIGPYALQLLTELSTGVHALRLPRWHVRAKSSPEQENRPETSPDGEGSQSADELLPPGSSSPASAAESRRARHPGSGGLVQWWLRQSDVAKATYGAAFIVVIGGLLTAVLVSGGSGGPDVTGSVQIAPPTSNVQSSLPASPPPSPTVSAPSTSPRPVPRPPKTQDVVVAEGKRATALGGQVAIAVRSLDLSLNNDGWVVYGSVTETSTGATLPLRGAPVGFHKRFGENDRYMVVITCAGTGCVDDTTAQFEVSRR